jgi:hypothetical protein
MRRRQNYDKLGNKTALQVRGTVGDDMTITISVIVAITYWSRSLQVYGWDAAALYATGSIRKKQNEK